MIKSKINIYILIDIQDKIKDIPIYSTVFNLTSSASLETDHQSADWLSSCIGRGVTNCLTGDWLAAVTARSGRGLTVAWLSHREVRPYIQQCHGAGVVKLDF